MDSNTPRPRYSSRIQLWDESEQPSLLTALRWLQESVEQFPKGYESLELMIATGQVFDDQPVNWTASISASYEEHSRSRGSL